MTARPLGVVLIFSHVYNIPVCMSTVRILIVYVYIYNYIYHYIYSCSATHCVQFFLFHFFLYLAGLYYLGIEIMLRIQFFFAQHVSEFHFLRHWIVERLRQRAVSRLTCASLVDFAHGWTSQMFKVLLEDWRVDKRTTRIRSPTNRVLRLGSSLATNNRILGWRLWTTRSSEDNVFWSFVLLMEIFNLSSLYEAKTAITFLYFASLFFYQSL